MNRKLLLACAASCAILSVKAQRYIDDVFPRASVVKTSDVNYGENFYFLAFPPAPSGASATNPIKGPMFLDIYTPPTTDTESERPLIIWLHTGSFLPKYFNGTPTGSKSDSTVVEACTRFAMKGYVAAAIQYRLGWNPLASTLQERTAGILNAVYRAIIDTKTAVRFFKSNASTYGINPNKIIIIGQGSGGYVSLAYNFLNKQSETELPKFVFNGASVVNPLLVGDVNGVGGQFNFESHPGVSNRVAMTANVGGCLGDISWIENDWTEVPHASIHCRKDIFAPYDSGTVIVPTTGQPVVFVHGSRTVIKKVVSNGLNNLWVNHNFTDPISLRAYALNPKAQYEGLFQIERPSVVIGGNTYEEGSPWEWWDPASVVSEAAIFGLDGTTINQNNFATNPDMSKAKAMAYIDTIVGFLCPRIFLVINDPNLGVESTKNAASMRIFPNPANEFFNVEVSADNAINGISLYDLNGKKIMEINKLNTSIQNIQTKGLTAGVYIAKVSTAKGEITQKVMVK
jgi:predicted esterase